MLAMVVACDGPVEQEPDAAPRAPDARLTDAAELPGCTVQAKVMPPPGVVAPQPGSYCAAWTRIDGSSDPFPRYYDRADVEFAGVRWWASGSAGAKGYDAAARVANGCLAVDPFATPDGWSGSGRVVLCWSAATTAEATMGWCSPGLSDGHWTVRLTTCP